MHFQSSIRFSINPYSIVTNMSNSIVLFNGLKPNTVCSNRVLLIACAADQFLTATFQFSMLCTAMKCSKDH